MVLFYDHNLSFHICRCLQSRDSGSRMRRDAAPASSYHLASSDFHFFRSFLNDLHGALLYNHVGLWTWLDEFFEFRPGNFYRGDIKKGGRNKNNNGEDIIDWLMVFCNTYEQLTGSWMNSITVKLFYLFLLAKNYYFFDLTAVWNHPSEI